MTQSRDRAQRLLEAVKQGQTIFFKAGDGWDIAGPAASIRVGQPVTVTKQDGETKTVWPTHIHATNTVQGVAYRTAGFASHAPVTLDSYDPQPIPAHRRTVRRAQLIGAPGLGLALPTPDKHGGCYYCGVADCTDCG